MSLRHVSQYLDSYSGRDRVMRIVYYSSYLVGGLTKSKELQSKLEILSDQINSCRTVLRLFDDVPMLFYTKSYGLGREDPDYFMRACAITVNILDQIYYPLEHIAWAADCNILKIKSEPWWTASTYCWALSMYLMIMKSLRYYFILRCLKNTMKPEKLIIWDVALKTLSAAQSSELLNAARCLLDFIQAVHWLPPGLLWAGKLSQWQIGALGVISSLISIIQSSG